MNDTISLAFSIQPDGASSYALTIIPQADGAVPFSINLASMVVEAGSPDADFIAAVNSALVAYRASKGF